MNKKNPNQTHKIPKKKEVKSKQMLHEIER